MDGWTDGCCRSRGVLPTGISFGTSADFIIFRFQYLLSLLADNTKIMTEMIRQSAILQLPADSLRG